MIELNPTRFVNATAKAKQVKLYIRMFAWRQYQVRTPQGHVYTVRFETKSSSTYASCNCAAGAKNLPCYHIAAVFSVDVAVTTMRQAHVEQLEAQRNAKRCAICGQSHPNKPTCDVRDVPGILLKPQPKSLGRERGIEL